MVVLQDSGEEPTVERVSNSLLGRLDLMTWVISVLLKEQEPVLDQDERRDLHDDATRRTSLRYEKTRRRSPFGSSNDDARRSGTT